MELKISLSLSHSLTLCLSLSLSLSLAGGDQGTPEGQEASAAQGGEEKKKEGACCDLQGNCHKCAGADEDYNMWDNLLLFPG